MKRIHSLVLLCILVIAPMFPVFMVPTTKGHSIALPYEIPDDLLDVNDPDNLPEGELELAMSYFTETPSADGLYYVCRRGMDSIAYFGKSKVHYVVDRTVITLEFPGSNEVIPVGENPTGSVTNYMYGNDPSLWKMGVEDCAVLLFPELYNGVDLVYKLDHGKLKYEFLFRPTANPDMIHHEHLAFVVISQIKIQLDAP